MLPGTFVAVLLLIGLVPGHIYLSLTRGHRDATDSDSPVENLLGIVAMGLATTGISALIWGMLRADQASDLITRLRRQRWDETLIRDASGSIAVVLFTAVVLAAVYALVIRKSAPARYYPRALKEVLAERTFERTWLRIHLDDGAALVGALHGSDFAVDSGNRDIVLREPIKRALPGREFELLHASRVVVAENRITMLQVLYVPYAYPQTIRRKIIKHLKEYPKRFRKKFGEG